MLRLIEKSNGGFGVDPEDISQVVSRYREMESSVVNPTTDPNGADT